MLLILSQKLLYYVWMQLMVDKVEFRSAKPDILARTGPQIIERLNSRGKALEDALKSVCLHRKGLKVEVNCNFCLFLVLVILPSFTIQ